MQSDSTWKNNTENNIFHFRKKIYYTLLFKIQHGVPLVYWKYNVICKISFQTCNSRSKTNFYFIGNLCK